MKLQSSLIILLLVYLTSCSQPIDIFSVPQQDGDLASEASDSKLKMLNITSKKKKRLLMVTRSLHGDPAQLVEHSRVRQRYLEQLSKKSAIEVLTNPKMEGDAFNLLSLRTEAARDNYDYSMIYKASFQSFKTDGVNIDYELKLSVEYYQVFNQKLIAVNEIIVPSSKIEKIDESVGKFASLYFPLKGFVQETRGNKRIAKINLGASSGIEVGTEINFRDTNVRQENTEIAYTFGAASIIDYSEDIKATGEVVFLDNEFSWVEVAEKNRSNISLGSAAFVVH